MYPPPKDQQLRWSVSPLGSKLDSVKHVFNLLLSFTLDEEPLDLCIKVNGAIIFLIEKHQAVIGLKTIRDYFFCRIELT